MTSPGRFAALAILAGAAAMFALRPAARLYENGPGDVPRYAQMAYEMRQNPPSARLVPTFNGAPYHEAMPVSAWAPYAVAALEGEVTPLSARVLPALSAWLMVAVAMAFVRRRAGPRAALLAGGIVALSHLTYTYARSSRVEAPLALAVTAAIAAFWEGSEAAGPRRFGWYALAGLAAAWALCLKGPAAGTIVLALAPPLLWLRRWRALLEGGLVAGAVCVGATAAWAIPYRDYLGPEEWKRFWTQLVGHETIDKVESGYGKAEPWYQYLLELWPNFHVFLPPALLGLWRALRRPREASPLALLACAWVILPTAALSAVSGKQIRYFVPLVPGFAILAALEVDRWLAGLGEGARRAERALLAVFGAGALAVTVYYAAILPLDAIQERSSQHLVLAEAVAPLVPREAPLAVLNPPTGPGEEILQHSLLGLYLEHLQGAPRRVDLARPGAIPREGFLL
ncbi:MAG TPA: phospholipid carrier-dependent glycosyltransferase, partial [Planctomycetota bacterium]|nr:phospholipid carrier-dependent glycosyltransferase [Planctomycetota bacterium]